MTTRNLMLATTAALSFLLLGSTSRAFGQLQSKDQQKCLNKVNTDGAGVAKAQGNENVGCLAKAGMGKLTGTAQACLTADAKGKVAKKKNKTAADAVSACGTPPTFGYTSATNVNSSSVQGKLELTADIFGANLDAAVIDCDTSKAGCGCQKKVLKDVEKLTRTKFGEFLKCKKAALKNGATLAAQLVDCVNNAGTAGSIAADTKGKVQKILDTLNADIADGCDIPGVTAGAFPGICTTLTGTALGGCLDARVECRLCQIINRNDGFLIDCDLFDDGLANASCDTGVVPPPPPGVVFKGALLPTSGKFSFNAMPGLAGSDAACNSNFPGTHTCTFANLQAAEAAGDLDGAKDIANNTVTSFWAIDTSHPLTTQCYDTMAMLMWNYQTAHTGHFAEVTALNNGAGTLGPVASGFCLNSSWVGCCL